MKDNERNLLFKQRTIQLTFDALAPCLQLERCTIGDVREATKDAFPILNDYPKDDRPQAADFAALAALNLLGLLQHDERTPYNSLEIITELLGLSLQEIQQQRQALRAKRTPTPTRTQTS